MNIKIKKLHNDAIVPKYQTEGAAGFDFHANEDITILEGQTSLVSTGIALDIPKGYEVQVRSRSGLALKHGIFVLNSPGTIDSDYKKEVGVVLTNAGKTFSIKKGDRIAQGIVAQVAQAVFEEVVDIDDEGRGGFGSTGIN